MGLPRLVFIQVNVSVLSLLALTLERHCALLTPLAPRSRPHSKFCAALALIWSVSAGLALSAGASNSVHQRYCLLLLGGGGQEHTDSR